MSKRLASGYSSGASRYGVKVKCPDWTRDNAERWRIFSQPEQTERERALVRKREEIARVLERLRAPGLSQGMARELGQKKTPDRRRRVCTRAGPNHRSCCR